MKKMKVKGRDEGGEVEGKDLTGKLTRSQTKGDRGARKGYLDMKLT